jgi:hypothetical protein
MFDANVASYVFLAMIVGALFVYDIRNPPLPLAAASPAVGALHTINTSEVIYSSTYTTGFSPSLAALDGNPSEKPTADAAGLISPALASGEISFDSVVYSATKGRNVRATIGYRLTYRAAPDADGIIRHYSVVARPIKYLGEGTPSFFTDQSGVIRSTNEDRDATVSDPPLAG